MSKVKLWLGLFSLALLWPASAPAQARFLLTFKGQYWTTNAAGTQLVSTPANTATWLQDYVRSKGLTTSISTLALAYHVNGGVQGDSIDVIDKKSGATIDVLYGLYLGTLFDRLPLVSADGTQVKMLQYVYTQQNAFPAGSGIITEQFFLDHNGNTNRTLITGDIHFLILPDNAHALSHCIGTFVTGKPLP